MTIIRPSLAFFIVVPILLFTPQIAISSTNQDIVHVSVSGTDKESCGSKTSPCATPQYGLAKLDGGISATYPDILYLHEGKYNVPGVDTYNNATLNIDCDYCKVTAWEEDIVTLDGGPAPTNFVIGSVNHTDVTVSNLRIKGIPTFRFIPNLIFENNEVYEGISTAAGLGYWCHLFFIEGCENSRIRNNLFRDLVITTSCGTPDAIIHYGFPNGDSPENTHIEYNTFSNSGAIFLKDNPEEIYIHNNLFTATNSAAVRSSNQEGPAHNIYIYNNVFHDVGSKTVDASTIMGMIEVTGFHIYNNTFTKSRVADFWSKWSPELMWDFFNNISVNDTKFYRMGYSSQIYPQMKDTLTFMDYNVYSGTAVWEDKCGSNCAVTTNDLDSWKIHLDSFGNSMVTDTHSISANPNLVNTAHVTSSLDLRLTKDSPIELVSGGRGGDYPQYRGAWNPKKSMFIGYCPQGLGACNTFGMYDAIIDNDFDGLPDIWETRLGLDITLNDSLEDPDGDGVTNLDEYLNGTNPVLMCGDVSDDSYVNLGDLILSLQVLSGEDVVPNLNGDCNDDDRLGMPEVFLILDEQMQ